MSVSLVEALTTGCLLPNAAVPHCGAMNEFLCRVVKPATAKLYEESNQRCAEWVRSTNEKLAESSLPLRVVNLATVWTVLFKDPSRYNWLLQYYLRAGVTLSWVGTGRCLSSMDFRQTIIMIAAKLLNAAQDEERWVVADHEEYPGRERTGKCVSYGKCSGV
jgi:glutamate-1-semialdehyde 2,1-aminomutase